MTPQNSARSALVLGVAGSFLAGVIGQFLGWYKAGEGAGFIASVVVGMLSSLAWILLSGDTFKDVYGIAHERSPVPFSQPGIATIPLSFLVLVLVSLTTRRRG